MFGEVDSDNGNLRFMNQTGQLISAPEEERQAYEQAKKEWPDIYEKYAEEHPENIIYFKVPKEFIR